MIVTGMSGAGRSTAAKCLEDLGWFVVDNLPPALLPTMVDSSADPRARWPRIAVVVDVRSRAFFDRPAGSDRRARTRRASPRGCCSSRPPTTCWSAGSRTSAGRTRCRATAGSLDGIAAERELLRGAARRRRPGHRHLRPQRARAARHRIDEHVRRRRRPRLRATVMSFGFKYGLPVDADLVADMPLPAQPALGARAAPA